MFALCNSSQYLAGAPKLINSVAYKRNIIVIGFSNLDQRHRFLIVGTAHSGLEVVTEDGNPAVLAVLDSEGNIIEAGEHVAATAWEAMVAIYKNFLQGNGHMLVKLAPSNFGSDINQAIGRSPKKTRRGKSSKLSNSSKTAMDMVFGDYKSHIQRFITGDDIYEFSAALKYDCPPLEDYFVFSHSVNTNTRFTFPSCSYDSMAYETNSRL